MGFNSAFKGLILLLCQTAFYNQNHISARATRNELMQSTCLRRLLQNA